MRNIKFFAAAFLFAFCTSASAQFTNTKASSGSDSGNKSYTTLYLQYNPSKITKLDYDFNGVSIGLNRGISVSPEIPLFVEIGGALQFSWKSEHHGYEMYFGSIKVPISLTYNWQVANGFAIAPYAGLTSRFNIAGKDHYYDYDTNNMFSDEGGYKRFQFGWQIGANFKFHKKFYLGAGYGTDFNKFSEGDGKIHTTSVTAGIIF